MGNTNSAEERLQFLIDKTNNGSLKVHKESEHVSNRQAIQFMKELYSLKDNPFQDLIKISLWDNQIGNGSIKCLTNLTFPKLTVLLLTNNHIGDQGVRKLGNSYFQNLVQLFLGDNQISDKGIRHLINGNNKNLKELSLSGNNIGNEGVKQLANGQFQSLCGLYLYWNITQLPIEGFVKSLGISNKNGELIKIYV